MFALFDGAFPEGALFGVCFGDGLDHWQGQLPFAEVIADILARGLCVGAVVIVVVSFFVGLSIHSIPHILAFAILGNMMLASIGLAAGIWSQKFDHIAAVTNFLVTPLTFLSGTFYSISQLPEIWHVLALYNPFFYMIDGFRYGFIGHADGNVMVGMVMLVIVNILLTLLTLWMLRTGYKIKS